MSTPQKRPPTRHEREALQITADLAQTLPPDAVNFGNADLGDLRVPLLVGGLDRGSYAYARER